MKDYAVKLNSSVLMKSRTKAHPTEIMSLKGMRLAYASELDAGEQWDVAKMKAWSGDAILAAHKMHKDEERFKVTHKLLVLTNNLPDLERVEDAERRRFRVNPFDFRVAQIVKDETLGDTLLREEGPEILRWMIDGCLAWQQARKVHATQESLELTDKYLDAQDSLQNWLEAEVDFGNPEHDYTTSVLVKQNFREWCERERDQTNVYYSMRQRDFTFALCQRLQPQGVVYKKLDDKHHTGVICGIKLRRLNATTSTGDTHWAKFKLWFKSRHVGSIADRYRIAAETGIRLEHIDLELAKALKQGALEVQPGGNRKIGPFVKRKPALLEHAVGSDVLATPELASMQAPAQNAGQGAS